MERKLIPQGTKRNRSYTITLPMPWIKNNHLNKSLKVNLEIVNNRVVISAKKLLELKTTLDATHLNFIIKKLIAEKYKLGINEIEILFEDIKTLDLIREIVEKELIGFEILEQTKNKCIIKDISKEAIEDFEKSLRRSFYFLLGIAEETLESIKKNDFEYVKRIIDKDRDLNKLVYYCERQLNKKSQEYYGKIQFYFFLLERIENIGDMYKGICTFFLENKKSIKEQTINLIEELNKKLKEFNNLFYSPKLDYKMVKDFFEELRKIRIKLLRLYDNKNVDIKYLYYISGLFQMINGAIRALHSLKEV